MADDKILEDPKTIEDCTRQLDELGITDSKKELTTEESKLEVLKKIILECDATSISKLLYRYAKLVNYDYEFVKPIIEGDTFFYNQLETMGELEFNLKIIEIAALKEMLDTIKNNTAQ